MSDRIVRITTVVAVVVGFVVAGGFLSPKEANRAFFEAGAQIIPVLFLAFAVETQALRAQGYKAISG